MKKLTSIILILFLSLLSSPSWSEALTMDDLVQRDGLYYKKFTNKPITAKIETYWENGQLKETGEIIQGKKSGPWIHYSDKGNLDKAYIFKYGKLRNKILYENGIMKYGEGFHEDGKLFYKETYLPGKIVKTRYLYYESGNLKFEFFRDGDNQSYIGKMYFENGNLKLDSHFTDGLLTDGKAIIYNICGYIVGLGNFKGKKLHGKREIYESYLPIDHSYVLDGIEHEKETNADCSNPPKLISTQLYENGEIISCDGDC